MRTLLPQVSRLSTRVLGAVALFVAAGCVAPADEMRQFVNRTKDVRGVDPSRGDGGGLGAGFDGALPEGSFQGEYFVSCLPALLAGNVAKTLKFHGTLAFVAAAGGGELHVSLKALKYSASDLSALAVDASGTPGMAVAARGAVSAGSPTFLLDFGAPQFPGEFNSISGAPIVFGSATVRGLLSSQERFCGELDGSIREPRPIDLSSSTDTCIFQRVDPTTGLVPKLGIGDFQGCVVP